jgi:hypothetical protein
MEQHKQEAIANADAYANNAGLPTYSALVDALDAIAGLLECPRDRLGRLDIAATQGEARERMRMLAVKLDATGGTDYMHQCSNVARALLRQIGVSA